MSEFEEAYIITCPICKTKWASCEGPLCDCYENKDKEEINDQT